MLTQRMKQKNPAVVEETYQYFASTFSSPPRMSHEGMRAAIDMLQQRSPETKFDTNVGKYVDERLMDELEREGFFQEDGRKELTQVVRYLSLLLMATTHAIRSLYFTVIRTLRVRRSRASKRR